MGQFEFQRGKTPHRSSSTRVRARKYQTVGHHTREEWEALKWAYGNSCLKCGIHELNTKEGKLTKDHIIPLSERGTDFIHNIQPLCKDCNNLKNNKKEDYR